MTAFELELRESDDERVAIVELTGELDLTNAEEAERRIAELGGDRSCLVLELSGLRFIDSAALHALFRLARRLEGAGVPVGAIVGRDAVVSRTLAITGLDRIVTVGESLDDVLVRMPR